MTTKSAVVERDGAPRFPPAGTSDTHVHVFDPERFPYAADRRYTPGRATVSDLRDHCRRLGVDRVVLVQPSPYGTDNACLLAALAELGEQARAVAVIDPATTTDRQIQALVDAGVVGVRVNLEAQSEHRGQAAAAALRATLDRVSAYGLMVQLYADISLLPELAPIAATATVPVVFDHFGGVKAAAGPSQPGFGELLELLRTGPAWVKLSGPYRVSNIPGYTDLTPIAAALLAANPRRLVWASDWPHTGGGADRAARSRTDIEPFRTIDNPAVLADLATWCGSEQIHRQILVDNPTTLYRF